MASIRVLVDLEIDKGDRVACIAKNLAEIIALHFACAKCEAIFVPMNYWRLSLKELYFLVNDCSLIIVFGDQKAEEIGWAHEPIDDL